LNAIPLLNWQILALAFLVLVLVANYRIQARRREAQKKKVFEENQAVLASNSDAAISLVELREKYAKDRSVWQKQFNENESDLRKWRDVSYDYMEADELLDHANLPEKESIAVFLGLPSSTTSRDLVSHICAAGSHSLASWLRGHDVKYTEIAQDVASKVGVKKVRHLPAHVAEKEAVVAALNYVLANAAPDQRNQILAELGQQQGTSMKGMVGVSGGLVAAHLSGFALYTAASSTLAAVAGVAGVTLPFAAFTTMSTVLSIATGPVGWGVLGGWAIYKLGGADFKKTLPCVLSVAAIRARLNDEKEKEISALEAVRNGELATAHKHLQMMYAVIELHEKTGPGTLIDRNLIQ